MKSINEVFIKAKEKKVYKNIIDFRNTIEAVGHSDPNITIDWDTGAGEEWARLIKSDIGVVCMMNTKIGIAFARKQSLNKETIQVLESLFIVEVVDFSSDEWFVDLDILREKTPEIDWNATMDAVNIEKMSLSDLYFATV